MMYPILCNVRYETLHRSFRQKALWIQVGFSVVVNWIIAPFFMVRLGKQYSHLRDVCAKTCSLRWRGRSSQTKEVSGRV